MSANPHDAYNHCCCPNTAKAKSRPGILGILTRVVVTYLVLVLAGGTMINTGASCRNGSGRVDPHCPAG